MARRGKFGTGGTGQNYSGDIRSYIAQSLGTDAVPAEETPAVAPKVTRPSTASLQQQLAAAKPDYSGLDFTGLDRKATKQLKKSVWTPEYKTARKAVAQRKRELMTPFTEREIATDAARRAIAGGITYEQALANYRKYTNTMNKLPSEGSGPGGEFTKAEQARYRRVISKLSPEQRESRRILFLLGGLGRDIGVSRLTGETGTEQFYRRMGLEAPYGRLGVEGSKPLPYAPLNEVLTASGKTIIPNPLGQRQRSRLQRLRSLGASSLTARQRSALARLRAKKNAPTPYSGEE